MAAIQCLLESSAQTLLMPWGLKTLPLNTVMVSLSLSPDEERTKPRKKIYIHQIQFLQFNIPLIQGCGKQSGEDWNSHRHATKDRVEA
ncbi:hypothetical protein AOLI_G00007750 [Acnodon oligacanthus]